VLEIWNRYNYKPTGTQKQLAKSGANLISEVNEILEVSFVPIPANKDAGILSVKSLETPTPVVDADRLLELFQRAELADSILTAAKR
jgi:phage head maturation protease